MSRLHKHIHLALLAVMVMAGSALAQEGEQTEAANLPMVAVSQETFDFGRVAQGSSISHVFWIKNVGGDSLKITDVKPG